MALSLADRISDVTDDSNINNTGDTISRIVLTPVTCEFSLRITSPSVRSGDVPGATRIETTVSIPTPAAAPPVARLSLDDLVDRARTLAAIGRRTLLGLTGAPGAGKSTVSAALLAALGEQAVLVGMDGFHLANTELVRLGRRQRKGAFDTFDLDGYLALLRRLRRQTAELIYAPSFDRELEESIGSAAPVHRDTPLVITEGNYLLLDRAGWAEVRGCLDQVWYLEVPTGQRVRRLVGRRRSHGDSPIRPPPGSTPSTRPTPTWLRPAVAAPTWWSTSPPTSKPRHPAGQTPAPSDPRPPDPSQHPEQRSSEA